jgi:hypothetical protein
MAKIIHNEFISKIVVSIFKKFSQKILLKLTKKCKLKCVLSLPDNCVFPTFSFDLWMSYGTHDVFTLVIGNQKSNDWII